MRRAMGVAGRRQALNRLSTERYRREIVRHLGRAVEQTPSLLVLSPSADLYGSDRALVHALPALTDRRAVVVAMAAGGPLADEARRQGAAAIEVADFAFRRRLMTPRGMVTQTVSSLRAMRSVRRLARRHRADLIYVNTVAVTLIPILRLLLRRPVLVHVHERALGGRTEAALIRWGLRVGADVVVANSEWTAQSLTGIKANRVRLIYNGIDPTEMSCTAAERGIRDIADEFRLLAVARLHPKKGHDVLVDATARLVEQGVDAHLDIVGDALPEHAGLETSLREQVSLLSLDRRVVLHGYRNDVDRFYRSAHVIVVASVSPEEFSLVAAEGQMRGLPAVVTGPGGVTEVVEHGCTGLVVTPNDAVALSDAVRMLALEPARARSMGEAGRRRMLDRFVAATYRERIADLVDQITSKDPS